MARDYDRSQLVCLTHSVTDYMRLLQCVLSGETTLTGDWKCTRTTNGAVFVTPAGTTPTHVSISFSIDAITARQFSTVALKADLPILKPA